MLSQEYGMEGALDAWLTLSAHKVNNPYISTRASYFGFIALIFFELAVTADTIQRDLVAVIKMLILKVFLDTPRAKGVTSMAHATAGVNTTRVTLPPPHTPRNDSIIQGRSKSGCPSRFGLCAETPGFSSINW